MNNTVEIGEPLAFFDVLLIYFRYCVSQLSVSNKVSQNLTRQLWARVRYSHHTTADTRREFKKNLKIWGQRFKGEHLCRRRDLTLLQRGACDLCPQLCDFWSPESESKHTCWKACREWSLPLANHSDQFKLQIQGRSGNLRSLCDILRGFYF